MQGTGQSLGSNFVCSFGGFNALNNLRHERLLLYFNSSLYVHNRYNNNWWYLGNAQPYLRYSPTKINRGSKMVGINRSSFKAVVAENIEKVCPFPCCEKHKTFQGELELVLTVRWHFPCWCKNWQALIFSKLFTTSMLHITIHQLQLISAANFWYYLHLLTSASYFFCY
jgi:hypothetical protein